MGTSKAVVQTVSMFVQIVTKCILHGS